MTEYANTPSVIEEWNHQRDRTHTWVTSALPPEHCAPPSRTPSSGSEYARRSLWDGSGWEPQSDCESATSIPPTMMLQYSNDRTEIVTPSQSETSGWMGRGKGRARARDEERTERAPSHHQRSSAHSHQLHNSVKPVQTAQTHHHPTVHSHSSSVRLAHAAAAPLPESRSSSGGSGSARSRELRSNESLQRNPRTSSKHSRTSFDRQPSTSPGPAVHTSPSPISPVGPASNVAASHHSQSQSHAQAYVHSRSQSQTAPQPLPPSSFRSNSLSTSRTLSSDPEPIIVHPPAPPRRRRRVSLHNPTRAALRTRSRMCRRITASAPCRQAVHVPLPPPSTASAVAVLLLPDPEPGPNPGTAAFAS
ncbi:hypothetical protein DFH11DRAFT_830779 [Phellopilus nigrolimitatus]|nr:hypothetical protein DFH11DRAFT_830779 [Phellopilus nigrolimitatus]